MKKYLKTLLAMSLILLICVSLTACGKDIVGTWKVKTMSSQGVTVDLAEMGGSMSFEFKKDGTGTAKENMYGDGETTTSLTYSTSGDKITITLDGETQTFNYKLDGKTLTMDMIIEGNTVKLTMTK